MSSPVIVGKWYEQGSAAQLDATLHCSRDGQYTLEIASRETTSGLLADVQVSDRLGNVERKLTLPDGSVFATRDNDSIDQAFKAFSVMSSFVHTVESKLVFVAIALVVTIFSSFAFFKWGLPALSVGIANALPQKTNELIGAHTLEFLDDFILDESQLDLDRQEQIRQHFKESLVPLERNKDIKFTLHFRDWSDGETSIPNALALPSGDIILTDAFVNLAHTQNEIDAVILHEMGHVAERHGLQMVVQSTLVTTIVMMVTGDASGIADLGVGLGTLLLSTNYSRHFETEADAYAFQHMLKAEKDPAAFATMIRRMTNYNRFDHAQPDSSDTDSTASEHEAGESAGKIESSPDVFDYFSTHPKTELRVQQAQRYSECFKQGLQECQ